MRCVPTRLGWMSIPHQDINPIVYMDDVTSKISPSSTIDLSLFADDIALYCSIQSPVDYVVLQADITAIIESERHLKLHADKCCHLFVSHK